MERSHLDQLIELEDSYWWHIAKRKLVIELLTRFFPPPGTLVEGGIGSARNLVEFQQLGYSVRGFDIMPDAVEHAQERGMAEVQQHDLAEPWPLPAGSVRVAVLLDVIEHILDPVAVLRHVSKVLQPDGGIVVTVPAYPWLFGDWDRSLGHFRRYTPRTLRENAEQAGLQIEWISYWNSFSLPAAIALRGYQRCVPGKRKSDFPRVSPAVNRALLSAASCERRILEKTATPFGLSLVGVLRK